MIRLAVSLLAATTAAYALASQDLTMNSQGLTRKYRLHVPPSYNGKSQVPLVLILHGKGGAGSAQFENGTQMSTEADVAGFIAVYPTAAGSPTEWVTDWDFSNEIGRAHV